MSIRRMRICITDVERFWAKVDRNKGSEVCWPWKAAISNKGYGVFTVKYDGDKIYKNISASRFSLILKTSTIGEAALHSCDNRRCCNPEHLRWGDSADNSRDAVVRKRMHFGNRHGTHMCPESVPSGRKHWNVGGKTQSRCTGRFATKDGASSRLITANGKTMSLSEWARFIGINRSVLWIRIYRLGWTPDRAVVFGIGCGCVQVGEKLTRQVTEAVGRGGAGGD
jgi:hypothetical protein